MKGIATTLFLIAALGAGGYFGWQWLQQNIAESEVDPTLEMVATVERQTIDTVVEVSGDIEPVEQVEVKSEVSAKVEKIHSVLGNDVKRGDIMFSLDNTQLLTEKASAEIEIEGAQLQLAKSERDYTRQRGLFDKGLTTKQELDNAATEKKLAQNRMEMARKRLQTVLDRLVKTEIAAPMAGRVLELPVVEGQVVVAAASVNAGTMLAKLADMSELLIRTHINQVDVAKLKKGMNARFTVDSLPNEEFDGTIDTIAPTATIKKNIKGFEVEILIDNPDPNLRPGMTAAVVVPIDRAENVLAVPLVAVFSEPDGSKVVFVKEDEAPQTRPVEIGVSDYDFVEIKSGLTENEVVLLTRPKLKKGS